MPWMCNCWMITAKTPPHLFIALSRCRCQWQAVNRGCSSTYLDNRGAKIKESTKKQYRAALLNYSGDWLSIPIANITRVMVEKRHKDITEGGIWFGDKNSLLHPKVATGSKSSADLWARYFRAVYRFAQDHFRDSEGNTILPDPPTTVLSTKRQWNGITRRTTRGC